MSFEFIAYDVLKNELKEKIKELIQENKPRHLVDINRLDDSVVLLKEIKPDRYMQSVFLLHVIKLCDAEDETALNSIQKARILNAAAYAVWIQIADSYGFRSPSSSTFYSKLGAILHIKPENTPNSHEELQLFKELNVFLSEKAKNAYLDILGWLLKKIKKAEIDLLGTAQQLRLKQPISVALAITSLGTNISSNPKPFELRDVATLKSSINQSVAHLIIHHNRERKLDLNKLNENIVLIPTLDRRIECSFLLAINKAVTTDDEVAQKVLHAAVYFIYEKIAASYYVTTPEGSKLYNLLGISLDLNAKNSPSRSELLDLYKTLKDFLYAQCYKNSNPADGCLEDSPFLAIQDYNIEADLASLTTVVATLKHQTFVACKQKAEQFSSVSALAQHSMLASTAAPVATSVQSEQKELKTTAH